MTLVYAFIVKCEHELLAGHNHKSLMHFEPSLIFILGNYKGNVFEVKGFMVPYFDSIVKKIK